VGKYLSEIAKYPDMSFAEYLENMGIYNTVMLTFEEGERIVVLTTATELVELGEF